MGVESGRWEGTAKGLWQPVIGKCFLWPWVGCLVSLTEPGSGSSPLGEFRQPADGAGGLIVIEILSAAID